jgi:zinc/manganese transport system permease protein
VTATPIALVPASLAGMLGQPFMQRTFLAGTAVALLAGLVGYLVVLRAQVFAADALSHVALTGAQGALAVGLNARLGLFAATVAVGVLLALLGSRGRADDVVIGTVFAWILGLGDLALSIWSSGTAAASVSGAGATAAEGTQAVGALLLLGLVAAPAGAAHRWTTNPFTGLALSATLAVGCMVAGLTAHRHDD